MASALSAASAVVAGQQAFAKEHDLGAIFATLEIALIVKKPVGAELLPYLSDELARISAASAKGERYVPEGGRGVDTEEGAARYLQEQGVHALLEELLTRVLVAKPASPFDFLAAECAARIAAGGVGPGSALAPFFSDDDLRGIHSLFDATRSNAISAEQARAALKTVGVVGTDGPVAALGEGARVDADAFVRLARAALSHQAPQTH
jgi:hypothetical protein